MSLFKKKQPLEDRRRQRDAFAAKLQNSESAVGKCRDAATEAAIEGASDVDLDAAEAKTRAAEDRVATLRSAIVAVDAEIASREEKAPRDADREQRERTSRDLHTKASRVEKGWPALIAALREQHDAVEVLTPVIGELGMVSLFSKLIDELPAAFVQIAGEARARAQEVMSMAAPARLPSPPELTVITRSPHIDAFLLRAVKWVDDGDELKLGQQYDDVSLPLATSERANRLGVICQPQN